MKFNLVLAAIALAVLSACASAPIESATRESSQSVLGTVVDLDPDARTFTLRIANRRVPFEVAEGVPNFEQLETGDRVRVEYLESVAVDLADPGDTAGAIAGNVLFEAPEGAARPGRLSVGAVTTVVEFLAYDPDERQALVRLPSGALASVRVAREMRGFASQRTAGDRILITYTVATAIFLEEVS